MDKPVSSDIVIIAGNSHHELAELIAKYVYIYLRIYFQYLIGASLMILLFQVDLE